MESYILELYRHLAQTYEEIYGEEQRRKYWLVSSQIGEKIVDAGCGVGIVFDVVSNYVVCLDISIHMLHVAKRKKSEMGELLAASFWLPPFRERAFHTALFISVIEKHQFEKVLGLWRGISSKFIFEFRNEWRITQMS